MNKHLPIFIDVFYTAFSDRRFTLITIFNNRARFKRHCALSFLGAKKRGVQMSLKRFNRKGKMIAFIGIWIAAIGFAFNKTIGVSGTPDSLGSLSIPLIVIGILLLIASNFFRIKREK